MRQPVWAASRLPGGGMRSTTRLRTLLDNEVTVICTTPTYALHLAEVAEEEKIDLTAGKVRTIIVAGEPGGSIPATRSHIEQLWGGAQSRGSSRDDGDRSRQLRMSRSAGACCTLWKRRTFQR